MLKSLLKEKGISVYAAAKGSGLPYTTLNEIVIGKKNINECSIKTIVALSVFLGISVDVLLKKINEKKAPVVINQTWEDKRNHTYIFPLIVPSAFYDASRIHPLKQRKIAMLYEKLAQDDRIEKIVLFGSSVTIRCNKKSDIDLMVSLKEEFNTAENKNEISQVIQEILDWKADIVWMEKIKKDSKLEKNISKGVEII